MEKRIAMIGGGNMAGALVAGLVAAGYPAGIGRTAYSPDDMVRA